MKQGILRHISLGIWLLCAGLLPGLAAPVPGQEPAKERQLTEALAELSKAYQVFFSYDASLLREVSVDFELRPGESLDSAVKRLLAETGFAYEHVDHRYFVIYKEDRRGRRGERRIKRKIAQISEIESRTGVRVMPGFSPGEVVTEVGRLQEQESLRAMETRVLGVKVDQTGVVTGKLVEASSGEPLAFAQVKVEGVASLATLTDKYGQYRLAKVPAGPQVLIITFIGYETLQVPVEVKPDQVNTVPVQAMKGGTVNLAEVVISRQARGQAAAINQQVNSNTIVNVISREKIQQLPDVNAAEAVGRLPGISISRSGGEGSQVTVRGVSPRFNSVTVNGQRLPGDGAGNRSIDLSLVASDVLEGVEVFKALTPDKDGDAIGGTVNLVTRTADEDPLARVQLETGYHSLIAGLGTYKGNVTLGRRFAGNRIGIVGTLTAHRADRSVDEFDGRYSVRGTVGGVQQVSPDNVFLTAVRETRDRINGSLTADYRLKNGRIVLDHFYSNTQRDILERGIRYSPVNSILSYTLNQENREVLLNSSQLRGEHDFQRFSLTWSASRSRVTNETPLSYGTSATQDGGWDGNFNYLTASVQEVPTGVDIRLEDAVDGNGLGWSNNFVADQDYTAQVDAKIPFFANQHLNGYFKLGGKVRDKNRSRSGDFYSAFDFRGSYSSAYLANYPDVRRRERVVYFDNFIDPSFTGYTFPQSENYVMPYAFDPARIRDHYETLQPVDSLWFRSLDPQFDQYTAHERISAAYAMGEINLGKDLMVLMGARFESTFNDYAGVVGFTRGTTGRQAQTRDTTGNITRQALLPMFHLRWNMTKALSLRLAATRSLSRPDFQNLAPFERIDYGQQQRRVLRGSLDLEIPTAWNYDAFLTHYSKYGLITLGGFYKVISDVDIQSEYRDFTGDRFTNPTYGFVLQNPINSPEPTTVYGGEFEVQANFTWLPRPFDGLILNGNISMIRSQAAYPDFLLTFPPPEFTPVIKDTIRYNRLQGQPNTLANLSIGYEKGGFSGRVSMNYQSNRFTFAGESAFLDRYVADFIRWDAVVTQKFGDHLMVLLSLININNQADLEYQGSPEYPTRNSPFGWITTLAVRYTF